MAPPRLAREVGVSDRMRQGWSRHFNKRSLCVVICGRQNSGCWKVAGYLRAASYAQARYRTPFQLHARIPGMYAAKACWSPHASPPSSCSPREDGKDCEAYQGLDSIAAITFVRASKGLRLKHWSAHADVVCISVCARVCLNHGIQISL